MVSEGRVLVIDDNTDLTSIISMVLSFEGFSVKICNDLEEGSFCLHDWKPRLLLLDVNINGIDAREFSKKIKLDKGQDVKIILMSGDELTLENPKEDGADDYIIKPFDSSLLVQKISAYFTSKV
jgi:two-component system, OmpR family, response regulator CpxR